MPQLDFADFAPQLVWLVVTFVALYLLLSRLALPRISGVLEERRRRIAGDLERAEEMRRDAERTLDDYERSMAEARGRAQEIAQAARAETAAAAAQRLDGLTAELAAKASDAERDIAARRDEALANVRGVAASAASAALERLIGVGPDGAALDAAVERALAERGER